MQDQEIMRNEEEVVDNTDYITAIKELKQNSVSKDKYDALVAEKKELLDALIDGKELSIENSEPQLGSRLEYYKKYKENKFKTDLEYWENMVNLRKATIKEYGADPCVTGNYGLTPEGERLEPSYGEAEAIAQQFDTIEEMIKEADGNALVFETFLQSGLNKNKKK